ncbi:preprotein translocase subunit YajC [Aquisphaera giovannonii]|uniref:Sec translocon accessory complex subunit YajC n=1 Tax=Aquisphaera giovannonii TaxID=406548 RepID=A0A5B9W7W8_9BACT|nr:preprotein translocase subunit YajC [Aquisphaera giovannonii]QEH36229.1 preprotein translocase subunit YajC [Aquisphaera giovannonii]
MPGLLAEIGVLFAQDAGGGSSLLIYMLPIPFLFFFLIWLPQQQQEKKRKGLLDALKKNDRVVTIGGLYGTVISIDPAGDKLVLRIDDDKGVKVTMSRSSVARVVEGAAQKGADAS